MRLEKVYALRRVVIEWKVTIAPVQTDLVLTVTVTLATVSSLFWLVILAHISKENKTDKKKEIYIDIYIYINSRNNENDYDNDEDNVNDDDGSINWNYPCKALIIFDEQIILNKKKDYS